MVHGWKLAVNAGQGTCLHRARAAQLFNLRLERSDAALAFLKRSGDIGRLEALRNMLRAIGVPGLDFQHDNLFRAGLVTVRHQFGEERRIAFHNPRFAPDFDSAPVRIIDQEQVDLGIIGEVAERNILQRLKGILVGLPKTQFLHSAPPGGSELFRAHQQRAIKQALTDYGCTLPVIFNLNIGHTDPQMLIPSGGIVYFEGKTKSITLSYE